MKKIIAMLVVATMLLTGIMAITSSAAGTADFTVDAVKDGNQLDVTISITSDTPFAIANIVMYYNADALVVDEDSIVSHWEVGRKDTADLYLEEEGLLWLEISADDMEGAGIAAPQGKAFTLSFEITDETADYGLEMKTWADDEFNCVAAPLVDISAAVALPTTYTVNVSEVTTAPETTAPVVDETTAPVADETTAPVADETTAPAADETTAPDASETKAPETTKPAVKPQSPQTGDSMVFVAVIAVLALAACSTVVVVRSKKASK